MKFDVEVLRVARLDISEYSEYIARDSRSRALDWVTNLMELIISLEEMPERFAREPELQSLGNVRSVIFHSHKIVYKVDADLARVYVARVWHTSQRPIEPKDVSKQT